MNSLLKALVYALGFAVLVVVLGAPPLMLLWNWLMPQIFGLPEVNLWQAMGLLALSAFLFKSTHTKN